jgi:pimeloyl-ACP methyl ester carboxylesterase
MVALMRAPTSKKNDDEENDRVDDFDPFDRSVGAGEGKSSKTDAKSPEALALNLVRDILDLPALSLPDTLPENEFPSEPTADHLHLPVFLGHGAEDPKVSVRLGEKMVSFLSWDLLIDVTWKVYEDFGHWYKVPDEINDIVRFLKRKTSVPVMEPFGPNTAPVGW